MTISPVINLNGSSKDSLFEAILDAKDAGDRFIDLLTAAMPHGRDYPKGDYAQARAEHIERIAKARAIVAELYEIAIAIDEQG